MLFFQQNLLASISNNQYKKFCMQTYTQIIFENDTKINCKSSDYSDNLIKISPLLSETLSAN